MDKALAFLGRYKVVMLAIAALMAMVLSIVTAEMGRLSGAEARARAPIAGRYRLRPPERYKGMDGSAATAEYYLTLKKNGTVQLEEEAISTGQMSLVAEGQWKLVDEGSAFVLEIDRVRDEPISPPSAIRFGLADGFPVTSAAAASDGPYNLETAQFTIGAGEQHPLVQKLHRRLAGVEWLDFADPGSDLYTEETRKAVVAFQESQGFYPNGEVNEETWLRLGDPQPPKPTPGPLPSAMDVTGTAGLGALLGLPTHTSDGRPIVYLTFDDGPSEFTQQVIDRLALYNAKATFFVVGEQVELYPQAVRLEVQGGHYVGNHTFNHLSLEGLGPEEFMAEVGRTEQTVYAAAGDLFGNGFAIQYLRPPYGITDSYAQQLAAEFGYSLVLWDVDPQDWRRPGADVIADYVLSNAFPGVIVIMHDGGGDCSQTVQALETVLNELSGQGYAFLSIAGRQ